VICVEPGERLAGGGGRARRAGKCLTTSSRTANRALRNSHEGKDGEERLIALATLSCWL